jgi:hypothetical protein
MDGDPARDVHGGGVSGSRRLAALGLVVAWGFLQAVRAAPFGPVSVLWLGCEAGDGRHDVSSSAAQDAPNGAELPQEVQALLRSRSARDPVLPAKQFDAAFRGEAEDALEIITQALNYRKVGFYFVTDRDGWGPLRVLASWGQRFRR